jgi:acid phosphatase type 7
MKNKYRQRQFPFQANIVSTREQLFKIRFFSAVGLLFLLTVSVLPAGAVARRSHLYEAPIIQSTSTLTFSAEADAYVHQSNPHTNYGNATYLLVNGGNNPDVESFMRFTVNGATGPIQSARVRVFITTNASANSPAAYSASNTWTESGITWSNRPARMSNALDNKGSTQTNTWVEYNVGSLVTGNGTYTVALVADSSDSIRFSSREGSRPPELVITFGSSASTETSTSTPSATLLPSSTSGATPTATQPPPSTRTNTPTMTQAPGASQTATATMPSGNTITFAANADARVSQLNPTTNYGSATTLQADGNSGEMQISYIRFTTSGISGSIQRVRLRIFCTTNGTVNGPAVHLANNTWIESGTGGITWNNRPVPSGSASDNKTAIGANSWVEYDVAAFVAGNGTYTFALVADSTDGVVFSAREGGTPPQLVLTLGAGAPTTTLTATQLTGSTATSTSTAAITQTSSPAPVNQVVSFNPSADSYVSSDSPSTNYGSQMQLRGDGSPVVRSYLRFNVQGLNGTVRRAMLRLFANNASTGGYEIRSVSNNTWGELTITYSNSPAVGSVLDTSGSFNSGVWTTVDVTAYITANGSYNLALTVPGSAAISFASREVGNNAPQLTVETQGGPTATATATRTATSTNTPTPTLTPSPTATHTATSAPTSSGSVVLAGAGDIANCNRSQDEQTAQLLDTISGTVFTAGDNAYVDGTYTEYINCYDPNWGRHKSRTKPSPGNHDYLTSGAAGYFQYFNNIPSYYAYDLGAWRIYSLNSEISVSATSAQAIWLQNDLAANPRQCVLAYWHKARWSSGSNHGDYSSIQPLWQILYDAGAELVIAGHEHHYERFAEMNASGAVVSQGLREIVVGTGGAALYPFGTPKSASQVRNNTAYGVLKLTLHSNSYDWQFVPAGTATFTDSGSTNCH